MFEKTPRQPTYNATEHNLVLSLFAAGKIDTEIVELLAQRGFNRTWLSVRKHRWISGALMRTRASPVAKRIQTDRPSILKADTPIGREKGDAMPTRHALVVRNAKFQKRMLSAGATLHTVTEPGTDRPRWATPATSPGVVSSADFRSVHLGG